MPTAPDLSVVIPTAGPGRRMRSYGPKALIQLGDGRTVIRRQIDVLRAAHPGIEIVVVVGFEGERVVRSLPSGVRVVENEGFDGTSVSRSISMGLRATTATRALVVYGDLAFNREAIASLPDDRSAVLVDSSGGLPANGVGVTVVDGKVAHFGYGLPVKFAHIMHLAGRELELFRSIGSHKDKRRLLGFEVLNSVIDRGGELWAAEVGPGSKVIEIDSSKDIVRAREKGL